MEDDAARDGGGNSNDAADPGKSPTAEGRSPARWRTAPGPAADEPIGVAVAALSGKGAGLGGWGRGGDDDDGSGGAGHAWRLRTDLPAGADPAEAAVASAAASIARAEAALAVAAPRRHIVDVDDMDEDPEEPLPDEEPEVQSEPEEDDDDEDVLADYHMHYGGGGGDDDEDEEDGEENGVLDAAERAAVPLDDAAVLAEQYAFTTYFEEAYSSTHPPFCVGTFADAREAARSTGKLLLLYLHDRNDPMCDLFASDVWCNETVVDIVRSDFMMWVWDMSTPVLRATMRAIIARESRLPFLAASFRPTLPSTMIIATVRGRMPNIHKIDGYVNADEAIAHLINAVEENREVLEQERRETARIENERNQRDRFKAEQEAAYQQSLEDDRRKEQARAQAEAAAVAERERAEAAETLRREQEAAEEAKRRDMEALQRATILARLPDEPPENAVGEVCKLMIWLPTGDRVKRRFWATDRLASLVDVVTLQGFSGHLLQTTFPQRVLNGMDPALTLKEAGLFPTATVHVKAV